MSNIFDLGARFSVVDRFSGPIQGMIRQNARLEGSIAKAGKAVKMLGVGLAIVGGAAVGLSALKAGAEAAGGFQTEVKRLALISQASAQELANLEKYALKLGVLTEWSPNEAVQGMTALAAAGYSVNEQFQATPAVLDFATAGVGDLTESAKILDSALKSWQMDATEAYLATDKMTRITQLASIEMTELGTSIPVVSAAAAQAKQSMSSALAVFGAIRPAAQSTQDAAQIFNSFAEAIKAPTLEMQRRIMRDYGIEISNLYRNAKGEMLPMVDIIDNLSQATAGMNDKQRDLFLKTALNTTGAKAFSAILGSQKKVMIEGQEVLLQGTQYVRYMMDELDRSKGTTKHFAEEMKKTWVGIKKMLSGTLDTFKITLGKGVMNVLSRVITGITNLLNPILAWCQEHQELVDTISASLAIFLSFFGAVGGIAAIIGIAKLAVVAFGAAFGAALSPILGIAVAVGAAAAVFYILYKRCAPFRRMLAWLKMGFEVLWNGIKNGLEYGKAFGQSFLQPFREIGSAIWDNLKPAFEEVRQAIAALFPECGEGIEWMKIFYQVGRFAGQVIGGAFWAVGWVIKELVKLISGIVAIVITVIARIGKAIAGIIGFFKTLGAKIKIMFADMALWILEKLNWVISKLPTGILEKMGLNANGLQDTIDDLKDMKLIAQASMQDQDRWQKDGAPTKFSQFRREAKVEETQKEYQAKYGGGEGDGSPAQQKPMGPLNPPAPAAAPTAKKKQSRDNRPVHIHGPVNISVQADNVKALDDLANMMGGAVMEGA